MPTSRFARSLRRWWGQSSGANQPVRRLRAGALNVEALEDRSVPATTISIADASVVEPAANGSANLVFTATRTGGDQSEVLTVFYTTAPGTAQPNVNFTPVTGVATFEAGSATARIAVPVFNDGTFNYPDLTFSLQLTGVAAQYGGAYFGPQQTFDVGGGPLDVALGDINGDGRPDIVAPSGRGDLDSVSVLLNTTPAGASAASFAAQQAFAAGRDPDSVSLGDINGDGRIDIVVASWWRSAQDQNVVSVLLNTTPAGATTASFAAQQTFTVGTSLRTVELGDMNGDGRLDIVTVSSEDDTVLVLLNTAAQGATTLSFAAQQTFATGSRPFSVALGDINGDGRLDIAAANANYAGGGGSTVSVLLNTTVSGATTLTFAAQQAFASERAPLLVTLGDINGDTRPDIITTNSSANEVLVLVNTTAPGATAPSFAAQQQIFSVVGGPRGVALGDANGDGRPDIFVAGSSSEAVSVLTNVTAPGATTISFNTVRHFSVGLSPYAVTVGDVNGDGQPDVVAANSSGVDVSVLLNSPVSFTRPTATGTIVESPDVVLNGTAAGDELSVVRTPGGDVGSITFTLNGVTRALTGVTSLTFNGLDGNDTLVVSKVNGGPLLPGVFRFDGGAGTNALIVDADGATTQSVVGLVTFGDPQDVAYTNVARLDINNAATSGVFPAPNTADRATAFVGLSAPEHSAQSLYLDLLGRAGSRNELAPWAALLATPNGARAAADAIAHSPEARDRLVRSWYVGFLDRPARNGEHAGFVAALLAGGSETRVLSLLLGSPEFYARAQSLTPSGAADERYVRALYQVLLNRTGSTAEAGGFVRAVPAVGRPAVALEFLNSGEFRTYQVEGYYNALLHRPSDATGLKAWASSGLDLAAILVSFVSQPEFTAQG